MNRKCDTIKTFLLSSLATFRLYDELMFLKLHFRFLCFFLLVSVFLLTACGLDTIVYLAPPHFKQEAGSVQPLTQYLLFETSDTDNSAEYCRGFDILYKIYATQDELNGDVASIRSYMMSNPQASARYALETKKYQRLKGATSPLISASGTNRLVRVRLYGYAGTEKAGLYVASMPPAPPVTAVKRFDGTDFKIIPNGSIADDLYKTSGSGDYTIAAFFAVTVGLDEHFVVLYSNLLYLGFLQLQ